jgi:uncharacterized membrane protein YqjE
MARPSTRTSAIVDLLAAHRELSTVELHEARQTVASAIAWLAIGAVGGLVGWCALNAAVVVALHHAPWKSLCAVAGLNLGAAIIAALRARALLGRPFFALTRRELARDSRDLLEIVS